MKQLAPPKWYLNKQVSLMISFLLLVIFCKGQVKVEQPLILSTKQISVNDNVHCGLQDRTGKLWFGTTGAGVYCYDGKSFTNYTVKDGLNNDHVWSIYEDKDGNILLGTNLGISLYNGKSFKDLTINSNLSNTSIWSFYQDRTGRLWIGTGDSSVYQYDGQLFSKFINSHTINKSNVQLNHIQKILEDKKGNIWFASWNGEGLCRYEGESLTKFIYEENLSEHMVHCVLEDKNGNIWIGTRNFGVYRYDGKNIINFREKEGCVSRGIACFLEDKKGNIWIGTASGAFCYDGKSFVHFTTSSGLNENSVFSITEDNSGNLWFGTRNVGLSCYDGNSFTNFSDKLK